MKIMFQYLHGGGGGLSNIILLLNALINQCPNDVFFIVCSENSKLNQLSTFPNVTILKIRTSTFKEWDRFKFGLLGFKKLAIKHQVDFVWSLNLGSYIKLPMPNLLSINNAYQVYPLNVAKFNPGGLLKVIILRFFFRLSLSVADAAMVQTNLMKKYLESTKGTPSNIFVIAKAVEISDEVKPQKLSTILIEKLNTKTLIGFKRWLYVATATPHKNHNILFDVFTALQKINSKDCLVLTITEEEAFYIYGSKISELIEDGRLICCGWISKESLKALYDTCDACLMPSLLESLSSTHLEAMAWRKPQIVADLPYARDLCGDAAIYVNPTSSLDWIKSMQKLNDDINLQERLVNEGANRIKQFPTSWSECARGIKHHIASML